MRMRRRGILSSRGAEGLFVREGILDECHRIGWRFEVSGLYTQRHCLLPPDKGKEISDATSGYFCGKPSFLKNLILERVGGGGRGEWGEEKPFKAVCMGDDVKIHFLRYPQNDPPIHTFQIVFPRLSQ